MRDYELDAPAHLNGNEDHGMLTTSAYEQLRSLLSGGDRDFWDRPDGNWGEHEPQEVLSETEANRRADANSAYVIGSKALRRDELDNAHAWFAVAADSEHPGAAFRSALTAARRAARETTSARHESPLNAPKPRDTEVVRRWLRAAADWGHGDARYLIDTLRVSDPGDTARPISAGTAMRCSQAPTPGRPAQVEDAEFYDEMRAFLIMQVHGNLRKPGQETAELGQSDETIRWNDTGECVVALPEPAKGVPARSASSAVWPLTARLLHRNDLGRHVRNALMNAYCEDLPIAGPRLHPALDVRLQVLEEISEQLALAARPVSSRQVTRKRLSRWIALLQRPFRTVAEAGTSLRTEVRLGTPELISEVPSPFDRLMVLAVAAAAENRSAGTPRANPLYALALCAVSDSQGAVARAPLTGLLFEGSASVVRAAGAEHPFSFVVELPSLEARGQDSVSIERLQRFWEPDPHWEPVQRLPCGPVSAAELFRHAAEPGRAMVLAWRAEASAGELSWQLLLSRCGWREGGVSAEPRRD
ncbi:hypothetical protein LRE75_34375 [Streptomyces sp. 372A]